jgi:small nuclear ribonucleoprotein E
MPPKRVKRVMTVPINVIFGHLQVSYRRTRVFLRANERTSIISKTSIFVLTSLSFPFAQKKTRVRIWLYEDTKTQIEGQIIGFDEYMNFVLDDAVEIGKKRVEIGRILLKGDSITLLQEAQPQRPAPPPEA